MEKGFHAYEAALRLMVGLRPLHDAPRVHDRDLADQLRRAGSSVVLNLAGGSGSKSAAIGRRLRWSLRYPEGAGRRGRDRMQFYRVAQGSAREVRAALDVAKAWGEIAPALEVEAMLDRLLGMLWRLTHPRPGPGP
ncbi:MAG: hypothetical protein HY823_11420 [Acidobacteria bacterium]|nr:hypothetical protein [Acidobacteriota bacterium]